MALHLPRRSFLAGLLAAPAIVRATSIMPVSLVTPTRPLMAFSPNWVQKFNEFWDLPRKEADTGTEFTFLTRVPAGHWRAPLLTVNRISWDELAQAMMPDRFQPNKSRWLSATAPRRANRAPASM